MHTDVTVKLIVAAIETDGGTRFVIDGFPRNMDNLSGWEQSVGCDIRLIGVLMFNVPENVMENRLLNRGERDTISTD